MRDRDAAGRPLSGRPRDRLGRPLAHGAPDERLPLPALPDEPEQVLSLAQELLDAERPFEAHELLEEQWKRAPRDERELWRALAQLAVAVTHHQRGNAAGARALAHRSRLALLSVSNDPAAQVVDLAGLIAYAGRLEAGEQLPPPRLQG